MKRKIIKILAFLFVILFFVLSCGCSRNTAPITKIERQTIIQRDTTIVLDTLVKIRPDSCLLILYSKCDSNNNLLLSELATMQGDRAKIKYKYIDNYIYINCLCDSLEIEIEDQRTINKYITEQYIDQQKTIVEKDSFIKRLSLVCVCMLLLLLLIAMLILILKR